MNRESIDRKYRTNALKYRPDITIHSLSTQLHSQLMKHPWIKKHFKKSVLELYHGVHTATYFEMAACYAYSANSGAKRVSEDSYPVVFEIDVSGLRPLPDIDAMSTIVDSFDSYSLEYYEEDYLKYDSDVRDAANMWEAPEYMSEVNVGDDAGAGVMEGITQNLNIFQAALDAYDDDDLQANEAIQKFFETGDMPVEIAAVLTPQKRYLSDIKSNRIIQAWALREVWPEILEESDEGYELADKLDRAGYYVVSQENMFSPHFDREIIYDSGMDVGGEYHGTSSLYARQAFPEFNLPVESPFGYPDPDFDPYEEEEENEE